MHEKRKSIKYHSEWTAAMASLKVSEKVRIKPSRRQHKENERDCRTVVQQLVSSNPQSVLMKTSYKGNEQEIGTRRNPVTFGDPDQKWEEVEQNPEQETLPRDSGVEGNDRDEEQDLEDKILSGEFRWMSRAYNSEPAAEGCSVADSSVETTRGN